MMPQLGETVTEGTITRWMKAVGDPVERDEPLFEVSTDKVDSEVPSPAAGVLSEILVPEGDVAQVGQVLARLDPTALQAALAETQAAIGKILKQEKGHAEAGGPGLQDANTALASALTVSFRPTRRGGTQ